MGFISLDELVTDASFSSDTLDDMRMSCDVKVLFHIIDSNDSIATSLLAKMVICFLSKSCSAVGEWAADDVKELLKIKSTVTVDIKLLEKNWYILFTDANTIVTASFNEFSQGESMRTIIVHNIEETPETNHSAGTSCLNLISK